MTWELLGKMSGQNVVVGSTNPGQWFDVLENISKSHDSDLI